MLANLIQADEWWCKATMRPSPESTAPHSTCISRGAYPSPAPAAAAASASAASPARARNRRFGRLSALRACHTKTIYYRKS
jgi:hypothetical protein